MDSKQVRMTNGKTVFQFGAIDCFTRKRVVGLAPRLTSQEGARFLHKVLSGFPFPVQAIQSDGGSEFLGDFGKTVTELQLAHYFNRPNYPQGNGRIERSFRTDDDEFYHVQELPADIGGLETALLAWNHVYETRRPHQALGYLTPERFYQQWVATNHQKKGGGVRYVLTQHTRLTRPRPRLTMFGEACPELVEGRPAHAQRPGRDPGLPHL